MRTIKILFTAALLTGLRLLSAQSIQIAGTVTDAADGQPLPGALVIEKGTQHSVATDANGRYAIDAPDSATLVFSFIGMKTREEAVAGRTTINVALGADAVALEDVVMVAYGATARERLTGSVAVIRGSRLARGETSNITKALEGAAPGVQIASSSGQPGASAIIRVRGIGSIAAGAAPLLVVDGVPYGGALNAIAPQDIETFNILKDAAATSMYGARGSNGVVVITTKQGEPGRVKIDFDARLGVNARAVPAYDVLGNPSDFYELTWEAQRNNLVEAGIDPAAAGRDVSRRLIDGILGYNIYKGIPDAEVVDPVTGKINPAAGERKWHDNWLADPFKHNVRQEYSLSVGSGTPHTSAYFSAGYINDRGYVDRSDFSRISVRGKIDQKFRDVLRAGLNVAYAQAASNAVVGANGSSDYANLFFFSQGIAPVYPIYKYDLATGQPIMEGGGQAFDFGSGNLEHGAPSPKTRPYGAEQNPLPALQNDLSRTTNDNLSSRAYVAVTWHGFTFTANFAYDLFNVNSIGYENPLAGNGRSHGGIGYRTSQRYVEINANQLLNYSKEAGHHKIDVLLGHEVKADSDLYLYGEKTQFYDPFNPELANAGAMSDLTSYTEQYRLEGFLSRAEYSFRNKYMLSGSFRRDASSKFHPDVRWGSFWSVGAAWRIDAEPFLAGVRQLSNLRLRASYGTQGNDAIKGSNLYVDQYTITTDGAYPSPVLNYRGAPSLTWEKSTNLTVGLEAKFFDRLTLNVDYFIKETKDMINDKPLAPSLGEPSWIWDNQIDMTNSGWEIEAAVDILKTHTAAWSVAANLSALRNKLTRLPPDKTDPKGYQVGRYWRKTGGSIYDFYLPLYAGVDAATGKPLWYVDDANGQRQTTGVYADATYYETGKSAFPDAYGGLSTDVAAFGFDLSVQTAFQLGGYAYDACYALLMGGGERAGQNWHVDALDRWTPTNTRTGVPRLSAGDQHVNAQSDRFLTRASYFSIKNVTLGYNFPRNVTGKLHLRSLRLYVSGDNVWLRSARKGFDPRQTFSGVTLVGIYPALRTVSFGVSIGL